MQRSQFTNRYFNEVLPSIDCQYFFFNRDDFSGIPGSKKVILKISHDFKNVETVNHIDTSSYIYTFLDPFMFDTNNGILLCQEFVENKGDKYWVDNNYKFFLVTHDGWKTYERRDIPLYFWSSGYEYMKVDNDNVLCYSGGYNLNVKGKDTIVRGGILANYNLKMNEWTLVYKFPEPPKDYDPFRGIFAFGPGHLQKMNDSVCYGMSSRQMGYYPDSNTKYYDVFYRTRDGNKSWQKVMDTFRVDSPYDIQDMQFYDEMNGLIVGRYGKVLMTNDGGDTWLLEDPKQFQKPSIQVVFFVDWAGQFPIIGTRLDGEIFNSGDSLDIVFDNYDSLATDYSVFIWKQSIREWLKLNDSVNLNNGKIKIKLPYFENPYIRFKIVDRENNKFAVSNYFALKSLLYKENYRNIEELKENENLLVYPNPAQDVLFINLKDEVSLTRLYDNLGNEVVISRIENRIEFYKLPAGIYFLFVETKNKESYLTKVVVF